MDVTSETPRTNRSVAGFSLSVPLPYVTGHVVTAGEASILNQTLGENLSNNLRAKLQAGSSKDGKLKTKDTAEVPPTVPFTQAEAQAIVDEYVATYNPGVRGEGKGSGPRITDPVERQARALAKAKAEQMIVSKGLKKADLDFTAIIEHIFTNNRDMLMKEAAKLVAAQNKIAVSDDDGIDLSAFAAKPAAPATA
jgi:hypothetical protein